MKNEQITEGKFAQDLKPLENTKERMEKKEKKKKEKEQQLRFSVK